MAQTPNSNSRLSLMNPSLHHGLRLTPSQHATNSPYTPGRSSPLRSPIKPPRTELGIALKQVIGATASTRNAIDGAGRSLAFTAGAAAVIATHDAETGQVEQRFYRARPTAVPLNPVPIIYDHGAQTQPLDARLRTTSSPFGTPTREQDLSSGKFGSAKERVKAAVCVSLSPSGQFLAVGEVRVDGQSIFECSNLCLGRLLPACNHFPNSFGCLGRHSLDMYDRSYFRRPMRCVQPRLTVLGEPGCCKRRISLHMAHCRADRGCDPFCQQ